MKTRRIRLATTLSIALIALALTSQLASLPRSHPSPQRIIQPPSPSSLSLPATLNARGATFPFPLIQNWTINYHAQNPNITLNYLSVGSGAGQNALFNKTDDFDASDAPLNTNQRLLAPNVLHIPETIGSVTVSYNLTATGITKSLNLTGAVVAQIYLGQILFWNDPAIQSLNPGVTLPNHNITTVHRFDSSGTTFVFTSFLSQDSPTFASTVGALTKPTWPGSPTGSPPPIAITGTGNAGLASVIRKTPYSIGYVELNYAITNKFTYANIQNPAGNFITPTLATTANAIINYAGTFPTGNGDWSTVSLLNQPGAQTYPIASLTYFLVYRELNVVPSMDNNEGFQAKALTNFLYWAVNNGGQFWTSGLNYVPLPTNLRILDNASIASITFTVNASPISRTINLNASGAGGWNNTAITVHSGDTITFMLSSSDAATHQWFLDLNNNNVLDANETRSSQFSSTAPIPFAFTPKIGVNIPAGGSWIYKDLNNLANTGTLNVIQQQVAAPFHVASTLNNNPLTPLMDSSRVTTIGSLVIDLRTLFFAGNITVVAVDSTSGSVTASKTYAISNLQLQTPLFSTTAIFYFELNAAVLPYDLSSAITLQLKGLTATVSNIVTREIDIAARGIVDIIDAGFMFVRFNSTPTSPNWDPRADLLNAGVVNIIEVGILEVRYSSPVFR